MNRIFRIPTLALACLVLAGTVVAEASSYYYESKSVMTREGKKKGEQDFMRGWVDGGKVKLEFTDSAQDGKVKKGMYLLTTDAGETLYMVDPESRSYYEFDPELLMGFAGGFMDLQFSDVSMEKLGEKAGGTVLGHSTTQYTWRTQFTMEMNMMGMERRNHYDSTQDVWVTRAVGAEAWKMFLKMMPAGVKNEEFVEWALDSGLSETFPLRTHSVTQVTSKKGKTQTMTSETEVTELRIEPIDARVFEIPSDYTKAEMIPPEWGGGKEGEAGGPMKQLKGLFGKKKKDDG